MKLIKTSCAICGSYDNYEVMYPSNFSQKDFNIDIFSARRLPDNIHYQIVKCNEDGLVRSNPVSKVNNLSTLYRESKFTYGEEIENLTTSYLNALQPVLSNLPRSARLLEIGCGNGFILQELFNRGYKNVFGVEPSTDAVKKAPKKIRSNIKVDMLTNSILPKESFDFIFIFQTLDHIPNPKTFLNICKNLLKKGGYILAFNHNVSSISSQILKEKSPIIDIEHTYLYDFTTIEKLFQKHGLKTLNVYSPTNKISLRHLLWLLPLPITIKKYLIKTKNPVLSKFLNISVSLRLGNLCAVAQK